MRTTRRTTYCITQLKLKKVIMEEVKALGVQDFLMSGDQNIEQKQETEVAKLHVPGTR